MTPFKETFIYNQFFLPLVLFYLDFLTYYFLFPMKCKKSQVECLSFIFLHFILSKLKKKKKT